MLEFTSLHLQNYSIWRDVQFDFEPGLTFINGTNRSGKSALLKALRPVLFGSDLVPQGGHVTWTGASAGQRLMLEAHRRGKTNRYSVQVDGAAQHTERIADGRDLIDSLVQIPESLFDSTILLDGTSKHPLAMGKASSRLDWIYEILAFASYYEAQAKRVESLLKPINKQAQQAVVLREQIKALRPPASQATGNVEDLQAELDTHRTASRTLDSKVYAMEAVLNIDIERPARPASVIQEELTSVDNEFIALLDTKRAWEAQSARADKLHELDNTLRLARVAYLDALARLKRKPTAPERALPKLEQWIDECNRTLNHALEQNSVWDDQASLRELLTQTPRWDRSLEWHDTRIKREQDNIVVARRTATAHDSDETVCSLCGSDLSDRAAHAAKARAELKQARGRLAELQASREIAFARSLEESLVSGHTTDKELAAKRANIDNLYTACDAAKAFIRARERRADAGEVTRLQKPDLDRIEALSRRRRTLQHDYANAAAYEGIMRGLRDNPYVRTPVDKLQVLYAKARRIARDRAERITTLQDELIRAQTAAALAADYERNSDSLRTAFAEVRGSLADQRILKELRVVFGRDGLPARRLETGLELFVEGLNQYAPLVWDEPYKFDIEVGPRRCDIIAHRNREATSINNTMSGSEQRGWQLVCALALLRILPPSSRSNTIVLDELEANSDNTTRTRYVREGIPEVCKMVPQVIVVSPLNRTELPIQCNREFRVQKRAGRSTLQRLQ